jgi:hypothetical protein
MGKFFSMVWEDSLKDITTSSLGFTFETTIIIQGKRRCNETMK